MQTTPRDAIGKISAAINEYRKLTPARPSRVAVGSEVMAELIRELDPRFRVATPEVIFGAPLVEDELLGSNVFEVRGPVVRGEI